MLGDDRRAHRPQARELLRLELPEAGEARAAGEGADADQLDVLGPVGQPGEDLDQLELVVEVVLEPQHDGLALRERRGEALVAREQVGLDGRGVALAERGEVPRPHRAQLLGRQVGHRPLVQHVAPRQPVAGDPGALHGRRRRVAIGDMQHERSLVSARMRRIALAVGLLALLAPASAAAQDGFDSTIRRTPHGVPHIEAKDFAGLGYGYGYALAEDNLCTIAEQYVTVRAERSRFFGPDATYTWRANGSTNRNLESDFTFKRIIDTGVVEGLIAKGPPNGPRPEVREAVRGYTAGYNRYLRETGVASLPDPACRGAAWVRPIEEIDVYRRFYQLALLASTGVALDGVGGAQPPTPALPAPPLPVAGDFDALQDRLPLGGIGSNAYGLGRDKTSTGKGMLLGNPHFPWDGAERFYQAHLTIPGRIDVSGASLLGVPVVLIGHTRGLAWSHTVSTAFRFTPFELTLVPGSPTTYLVDGQPQQMTAHEVTVQARRPDGSLEPRSRTLYSTRYGPVFTSLLGLPLFPWTPAKAFALGDANAGNFRYLNHFFETNLAQSTREYDAVLRRNQGIPWVNSIGADSRGEAYYADISVVPHVTDAHAQTCNTALGQTTFTALRLPVLDGSRSACDWGRDGDALQPGTFGPGKLPSLFRRDYVTNSNDSYWLSNPAQPLTGFSRIIGDEDTERSLRTRLGLIMAGSGRFSLTKLQETVFNNRQYAGELWRDAAVEMCRSTALGEPCDVLARWNLRDDNDSRGALLFRRFAERVLALPGGGFSVPYSSADPVNTPRGLRTEDPAVRQALVDAIQELRGLGLPLDGPLRRRAGRARAAASGSRSTAVRARRACSTRSTCGPPT